MFSYCDLTAELNLQEISYDSNTLYPELSSNPTYYEENQVFSEISEPRIEHCKSTKTKQFFSPVEIRQESVLNIDLPPISWLNYDSVPKILNFINTGRTILINGQWTKSKPYITGGPLNGNYIFSQIHFHSPSEHEIDGKRYPLEMHVVHYKTSYLTQEKAMEEKDGTVVIVYLFQVLNSNESALSCISNSIHLIERVNDRTELPNVALNQILQPVFSNYYIYWGSVSTSKNSYSLQWIISCTNLYVTQNELDKFIKILCSNELFVENQVSQMNIINNIIYHVEGYDWPVEEVECSDCSDVNPKCYCRYHCQNCKICIVHKEEYLQFHVTESLSCASKGPDNRDTEVKISCEKISNVASESPSCDYKQKKKQKKNKIETKSNCSSVNSNSQSSICEDEKKNKNRSKTVSSCPVIEKISNSDDRDDQKRINFTEPKSFSSNSLTEKDLKVEFKGKNLEEGDQKTKRKNAQKSETSSCDTLKSSSKGSVRNSKTQNKKKSKKNTFQYERKNSDRSQKKEKSKKKQKKTDKRSESSADSLKNSESIKQEKKKESSKETKSCDLQVKLQCMPVLVSTDKVEERLLEMKSNALEENKEEEKTEKPIKEIKELSVVCEKLLEPIKAVEAEKTEFSEVDDDIMTIYEKKRAPNNSETPDGKDYTINFLLAPNTLQSKYSFLTSESECLEVTKNINSNLKTAVTESMNKVPESAVSSIKSQEQSKDICFETEHSFLTERKGDFSACVTQEYNMAVICNHNIIQEFRGTFHPNELEPGIYEKLHLVPKYPELENVSVRLDNCFVKKEASNQLYIRVKFLINKLNIRNIATKAKSGFEEDTNKPNLELLDMKKTQPNYIEEEPSPDNETRSRINSNQTDKKKVLENEECKMELLKKPDSEPKQSSKNITFDSLQQSSKLKKEEEERENNLIEKPDKTIKDLFYKRKKVYFSCEKVEKDENSGKKLFVGSFRTKQELEALSKDKKLAQKAGRSSSTEKSVKTDTGKSMSSIEELAKRENSKGRPKRKSQSPSKPGESDESNESKNLITLHKHKPKYP